MLRFADSKIKVRFDDLRAAGVVTTRKDLHRKIKAGRLPPPHKDGDTTQAMAWWYATEIDEAIERERQSIS